MSDNSGTITVSGTSPVGNLQDALGMALSDALAELKAEVVHWSLADISGVSGGYGQQHHLTVTITAKRPA